MPLVLLGTASAHPDKADDTGGNIIIPIRAGWEVITITTDIRHTYMSAECVRTILMIKPAGILALLASEAVRIHHPHHPPPKSPLSPSKKIFRCRVGF